MSLNCTVQIKIRGLSAEQMTSVKSALEPDNVKMPEGLEIVIKDGAKEKREMTLQALTLEFSQTSVSTTTTAAGKKLDVDNNGSNDNNNNNKKRERTKGKEHNAIGHLVGTIDEVLEHVQVSLKVIDDND